MLVNATIYLLLLNSVTGLDSLTSSLINFINNLNTNKMKKFIQNYSDLLLSIVWVVFGINSINHANYGSAFGFGMAAIASVIAHFSNRIIKAIKDNQN